MKHPWFPRISWRGTALLIALFLALVMLYPCYTPL